MLSAALLSTLHVFALVLGLPGVFLRGRALKALQTDPAALRRVFVADNLWGLAALLWIGTGLSRLFGPFEKGPGFYLSSSSFLIKMGLFALVFALEAWPMFTFIGWRRRERKGLP